MITRRSAMVGLLAIPGVLTASAAAGDGAILGPTVFDWDEMKPVKTPVGEVRSLCKAPTATLDQLEMHVTTLNPGLASHPPHRHVNEELIILREGDCETLSNGKWAKVGPGSVVFNASNSLHGFRNAGDLSRYQLEPKQRHIHPRVRHFLLSAKGFCGNFFPRLGYLWIIGISCPETARCRAKRGLNR
jgi:quercetin dioxygenase-like cupin family protein